MSTVTASIGNAKTFAADQTVTLTFTGTATYGTHYAVTPADTDGNTTGHQVTLTAGQTSVDVTVTAAGNSTADGDRGITIDGTRGGTAFGSATIVLRDDEDTNASPTFTDGASTSRDFNETIGDAAVATAANIDTPVAATDTDTGDILEYSLEGTDAAKFGIVTTSGQLQTKVGGKYDYEAQTSYAVTVKVEDDNGGSATIAVTLNVTDQNEAPLAPGEPSVSATTGSTTSLDVSWTAPTNTGRPSISNYDLQYQKTTETGWTNGPQNETGASASIGSLEAGTAYRVQVLAANDEGDSDWSTSGTGSTNTLTAQPAIESKDLVDVSEGNSSSLGVTLSIAPTSDRTVDIASDDTGAVTVTPSSLTFTSTDWAVEQFFDISAVQDSDMDDEDVTLTLSGTGLTSKTVTVTVRDDDNPPGAPTSLTATADGQSEIDLSWTAPASNGGSLITGYKIEASSTGNSGWSNLVTNTGTTNTTYSHTGLPAGTTRHYRVSAINANGPGTASNVADATTDTSTDPGLTLTVEAVKDEVTEGEPVRYRIVMSKRTPGVDVEAVYRYKGEFMRHAPSSTVTGIRSRRGVLYWEVERATVDDLVDEDDGRFTVRLRPRDGYTLGTPSSATVKILDDDDDTPPTVPGAPTSLTATASGSTRINLSWTAPADNGGSAITGYTIEVSPNGTSSWTDRVANTGTTTTTYSHTGLSAGTTRHYRVSAINSVGNGAASNVDDATTDDAATTVPGAPTSLTATASGSTRINLSWTAPADNGGSAITGYTIEVSPNGTSSWTDRVANTGTTTTTYSHTGLSAGTTRHYRVSAINSVGNGAASNVDDATTDDAEEPPTVPIVSVFDVRVDEGPGAVLAFPVRLKVAAVETATITWETLNGSAKAGRDYVRASGTLVFSPGDTEKTVRVEVIDDALVEGTEVMLLLLLDAQGAVIDDAVAKGTIRDNDAASDAADDALDEALEDALAIADGLTPDEATDALFGERRLSEARLAALDRLGNGNGRYDLGDLLSWIDRCRRGEARCGRTSTDSGPAAAALLGGAAAGGRSTPRRPGRRDSGRRGRSSTGGIRRRARMAGHALAILLTATMTWSCTEGSVGPVVARPDPGFLTVEWSGPAASRDVGVLLELEGPTIDAVRAPGLELYESSAPGPHRIVVAGVLRPGPLVQFRVPDRNQFALYRVRVLQVTGEGYGLRDVGEYQAVIKLH